LVSFWFIRHLMILDHILTGKSRVLVDLFCVMVSFFVSFF